MENKKIVKNILNKINLKKATISVIGLGYVGLPLCLAFLKAKFKVYGIDNSLDRIKTLKKDSICLLSKNHKLKKLIITILYQLIILKKF